MSGRGLSIPPAEHFITLYEYRSIMKWRTIDVIITKSSAFFDWKHRRLVRDGRYRYEQV